MNNTWLLIKNELYRTIYSLFASNKKNKKVNGLFYTVIIVGSLMLMASAIYSFMFTYVYTSQNMDPSPTIVLFGGIASTLIFISAINQARGIYIGEDYDMLTTLPLKKSSIIISKLVAMYVLELSFSLMIMIPHAIVLMILSHNVTYMLITLMLAFLLPVFPILLGSLFSLLLTILTARFKHANIISIVLYVAFFVGMFFFSFFINGNRMNVDVANNFGGVIKYTNPSLLFVELALSSTYLYLLAYIGVNIALFVITVFLFAKLFTTLHELTSSIRMKSVYVRKDLAIKNEFKTLFSIEMKRLLNSKVYFINSLLGILMSILAVVVSNISMQAIKEDPNAIEYYALVMAPACAAIAMIVLGISNPASASINMEGKTFWLTKSLPISMKKYMYAKLMVDYIFFIPSSLIASTIIVIFIHEDIFASIMIFVIPLLFVILSGIIALSSNVKHPRLKWKSEQEACKNAPSVVFTMLWGFLYSFIVSAFMITFSVLHLPYIGYSVAAGLLLVLIIIYYILLKKNFARRIYEIEDI